MIYSGPELNQCTANHSPLSPVSILKRVERVPVSYTHLTLPTNREV